MSEALIATAQHQAFWAWDEAEEAGTWYTEVAIKQWGCMERFLATAGRWETV
jgi:hypothetical protein